MNDYGRVRIASIALTSLGVLWLSTELLVPHCLICGKPIEGNDDELDRLLTSADWLMTYPLFYFSPLVYCRRCWHRRHS